MTKYNEIHLQDLFDRGDNAFHLREHYSICQFQWVAYDFMFERKQIF